MQSTNVEMIGAAIIAGSSLQTFASKGSPLPKKSLKLKSKENVQIAEPATVGVVPNLVFTFSPMEHIDTASVATQNEIEYNLKRLQEAQKIGSHTPKK